MSFVEIVKNFGKARVAVLGDFCLDLVRRGRIVDVSREAPAPILKIKDKEYYPGAAANVAYNLAKLGVKHVTPISVIGKDYNGSILLDFFKREDVKLQGIIQANERQTYVYEKLYARGQGTSSPSHQIYRIDEGSYNSLSDTPILEEKLTDLLQSFRSEYNIFIISDYSKGIVTPSVMNIATIIAKDRAKTVIGTARRGATKLQELTLLVLNDFETASSYDPEADEDGRVEEAKLLEYGKRLLLDTKSKKLIVTRGEHGMTVFDKEITNVLTKPKKVVDITGAGDTSLAAIAASLGSGASLVEAAKIGNYAAGIVVQKPGTATTTQEELIKEIENDNQN